MSFGNKKSSSLGEQKEIKPPTLSTPFGSVKGKTSGDISYRPSYLPGQKASMSTASQAFSNMLGSIPQETDFNAAFDNPMYGTLSQLMRSDLGREADEARRTLTQQQAARGNLNNSSGIYAQQLMERNIGNTLADNLLKARLGAFDAYRQNMQDSMNRASFFQNALGTTQAQILRPLEIYQGIAPLGMQTQQYNNALNQMPQQNSPGLFSQIMSASGSVVPKLLAGGGN